MPWLSLAIWTPIAFGILVLFFSKEQYIHWVRRFALAGAVLGLLPTIALSILFVPGTPVMQFQELLPWVSTFHINYHLGIDGISLWFIPLTALITLLVVIFSWDSVTKRCSQYYAAFLILSGLMIGVFSALDGILFYVFFEATLIPMYLIIGIWGGPNRIYAAYKFFLYTLLGSLLTLVAIIYLYQVGGDTFEILLWHKLPLTQTQQDIIFFAFLAAFAVKIPMWPVHTWLPDVHVEAPTGGSAILAAIMLKLGAYGFLRFSLPITPDAAQSWASLMIALGLIAIIYIGLVAIVQKDMKKLVAYSSVAHMGFVSLGIFIFNHLGMAGAIVQMIAHGFVSAAMFLCIGVLYDRIHSRQIQDYGGVINTMPKFAAFSLLFAMANAGLPATAGFVGEWMVIIGSIERNLILGTLAALSLILGASYTLWMYKRVYLGEVANEKVAQLKDIDCRELLVLVLLAVGVLGIGVYPKPLTDAMDASITNLLSHVNTGKL
jgi:NADH-quinone oxidoreductase subunit M